MRVLGISTDDVVSQATFAKQQKLDYALLSDPDASVVAKYGASMKGRPFASRTTFVIDDAGIVRLVDENVDVQNHGAALADAIRKLQG